MLKTFFSIFVFVSIYLGFCCRLCLYLKQIALHTLYSHLLFNEVKIEKTSRFMFTEQLNFTDCLTHRHLCGSNTVVLIFSCCLKLFHGKITRHYLRYCAVEFCGVHACELSDMCLGHDVKLHPYQVKLYRIRCVGSGLVLAKALT